ncbi:Toll-interacting protein B [Holothuria leucospilota]|uniref:Toll-interacting protein B n=1 Tax=Holothuria leucospilota TaxID=206669 RepID=A0A9Q1BSV2_HOLLE|nr:Toll-interacting protein B [Holothuria leucospilota]
MEAKARQTCVTVRERLSSCKLDVAAVNDEPNRRHMPSRNVLRKLLSAEDLNQFHEEERIGRGEDRPLTLEQNDFSFSSNIAVATERDTAELKENYGPYKMDPYCVMKVGSEDVKTHTCRNGSINPRWAAKLECKIPPSICYIFIEIFDQNTFQADEKIAWTSIPIKRLVESGDKAADWCKTRRILAPCNRTSKHAKFLAIRLQPNADCRIPEPLFLSASNPSGVAEIQEGEPSQANVYQTETVPNERNKDKLSEEVFNSIGGLSFCPTPAEIDTFTLRKDVSEFVRRIRLKEYFHEDGEVDGDFSNIPAFRKRSTWCPDKNRDLFLEAYVTALEKKNFEGDLNNKSYRNLKKDEQRALENLRKYEDIVISKQIKDQV